MRGDSFNGRAKGTFVLLDSGSCSRCNHSITRIKPAEAARGVPARLAQVEIALRPVAAVAQPLPLHSAPVTAPLICTQRELYRMGVDVCEGLRPRTIRYAEPCLDRQHKTGRRERRQLGEVSLENRQYGTRIRLAEWLHALHGASARTARALRQRQRVHEPQLGHAPRHLPQGRHGHGTALVA